MLVKHRMVQRQYLLGLCLLALLIMGWRASGSAYGAAPSGANPLPSVIPTPDPDVEPGFPVYTEDVAGAYSGGPALNVTVGNIDDDPNLEILASALAGGPLYAWNSDGSLVQGWPVPDRVGAAYPSLGNLSNNWPWFEVFSGDNGGYPYYSPMFAYSGAGQRLPGWPILSGNVVVLPAALADVDWDGLDEIFLGEADDKLHGYRADGSVLPGWPVFEMETGQGRTTPAIGDINGDGELEIVTMSTPIYPGGNKLFAYREDGSTVPGFPLHLVENIMSTFPVIGDVDGDGANEIVLITTVLVYGNPKVALTIVSGNGTIERILRPPEMANANYGIAPALADLDGDGTPEIIVHAWDKIAAIRGDGTMFPGWPRSFNLQGYQPYNSAPVVGDVDGDGLQDIVAVTPHETSNILGYMWVFNRFGELHPRFPKEVRIGQGGVSAIADIDLDGRNEIMILGTAWDGGYYNYGKVWAYDLQGPGPYGRIEWGQFMGGPGHRGLYEPVMIGPTPTPRPSRTPTPYRSPTNTPTRTPSPTPTSCTIQFADVPSTNTFYPFVRCLACKEIVEGYACGDPSEPCNTNNDPYFRPNAHVTRGQLAKIVSLSAGFIDPVSGQTFQDVPPGSTFYLHIERLAMRQVMSGYPCGGSGEPCGPENKPYFRTGRLATRGQMAKITANAAGFSNQIPPGQYTFTDVPEGSAFHIYVERLLLNRPGVMSGYACGSVPEEPCDGQNRPYFRPGNHVTRGQTSKIVANTFFSGCDPLRP